MLWMSSASRTLKKPAFANSNQSCDAVARTEDADVRAKVCCLTWPVEDATLDCWAHQTDDDPSDQNSRDRLPQSKVR